jgi:hypothetical protein
MSLEELHLKVKEETTRYGKMRGRKKKVTNEMLLFAIAEWRHRLEEAISHGAKSPRTFQCLVWVPIVGCLRYKFGLTVDDALRCAELARSRV